VIQIRIPKISILILWGSELLGNRYSNYSIQRLNLNISFYIFIRKIDANCAQCTSEVSSDRIVSDPGKGKCADPVNEDAILGRVGGGRPGQNRKRQFSPDTGDSKT
jgi:hypothetical protein